MNPKDLPAFPSLHYSDKDEVGDEREYASFEGMTLRDYFAAKALPKLIELFTVGKMELKTGEIVKEHHVAEQSYAFADAMLAERSKP